MVVVVLNGWANVVVGATCFGCKSGCGWWAWTWLCLLVGGVGFRFCQVGWASDAVGEHQKGGQPSSSGGGRVQHTLKLLSSTSALFHNV